MLFEKEYLYKVPVCTVNIKVREITSWTKNDAVSILLKLRHFSFLVRMTGLEPAHRSNRT